MSAITCICLSMFNSKLHLVYILGKLIDGLFDINVHSKMFEHHVLYNFRLEILKFNYAAENICSDYTKLSCNH